MAAAGQDRKREWLSIDLPSLSINSIIFSYPVPFWSFTHLISLFCCTWGIYACIWLCNIVRCNIHLLGTDIHECVETRGGYQYLLLLFLCLGFYWMWSSSVQLDWPANSSDPPNSNLLPSIHTSAPGFLCRLWGLDWSPLDFLVNMLLAAVSIAHLPCFQFLSLRMLKASMYTLL